MATDLIDLAGHEQVAVLPRPRHRAARDHRAARHRPRAGARRAPGSTRTPPRTQALADVLRLSRGDDHKNAVAGLDHGGGKAVIIGDPRRDKTPRAAARLRPLRRVPRGPLRHRLRRGHLCRRHGRRRRDDPLGHRALARAAAARATPRVLTAYGVFEGSGPRPSTCGASRPWPGAGSASPASARSAAAHRPPARGRRRGRGHRRQRGCRRAPCCASTRRSRAVADTERPGARGLDVYAPARSAVPSTSVTVAALRARVVCGGRQQPAGHRGRGRHRRPALARGITYAPDFLVNAGGVIQVSDELHGFDLRAGQASARPRSSSTPCEVLRDRRRPRHHPRSGRRPASPSDGWPEAARPLAAAGIGPAR